MNEEKKYIAFISYRHLPLDKVVAKKIHGLIEHYHIPKDIAKEFGSRKPGKVFRDEEELPASDNLTEQIQSALDRSEYLLVICSPGTPESVWVQREIEYFLKHHDRKKMIAILVEGTPEESFPELLTTVYNEEGEVVGRVEPLAANLTDTSHHYSKRSLNREIVRIYAALLNIPFDKIWQRERRYRIRRILFLAGFAFFLLITFTVYTAVKNRQISERNRQIETQNVEIERKNEEIMFQNASLDKSRAEAILRESELLSEKGDLKKAVKRVLDLTDTKVHRQVYGHDAAEILFNDLFAGQYQNRMITTAVIEQENDISQILLSKDTKYLYSSDETDYVRCFSTTDGSEVWKKRMDNITSLHVLDRHGILLAYDDKDYITAFQMESGETVWEIAAEELDPEKVMKVLCVSEDTDQIALVTEDTIENNLYIVNAADGKIAESFSLGEMPGYWDAAAFSENKRYIAANNNNYDVSRTYLMDLKEKTITKLGENQKKTQEVGVVFNRSGEGVLSFDYDNDKSQLVVKEYNLDGTEGNTETCSKKISFMELYAPSIQLKKELDGTCIAVMIEDSAFLFLADHGEALIEQNLTGSRVVDTKIFDTDMSRFFLYEEGSAGFLWEGGVSVNQGFSEKKHFSKFAISEDYVLFSKDMSYYSLNPEAVEAVICDDDARTIYVLRPAMDPNVETLNRKDSIDHKISSNEGLIPDGDSHLIYYGKYEAEDGAEVDEEDAHIFTVQYISNTDGSTEKTYSVDETILGNKVQWRPGVDGVFWPGADKYSCIDISKPLIIDLKTGKTEAVFGGKDNIKECVCMVTKSGEVLHAAIISETDENYDTRDNVYIREGNGEIKLISDTPVNNYLSDTMQLAGSGRILYGTYTDSYDRELDEAVKNLDFDCVRDITMKAQSQFEEYCSIDVNSGEEHHIKPVAGSADYYKTIVGETLPVFANIETDNKIRIYDMDTEAVKNEIDPGCDAPEIKTMCFCNEDGTLAVCTTDKKLLFFDVGNGELLHEEHLSFSTHKDDISMKITKDENNNRYCVRFSNGQMLFAEEGSFECGMQYSDTLFYLPDIQKIYAQSPDSNVFLCYPAYTEEDLIRLGEEYVKDEKKEP